MKKKTVVGLIAIVAIAAIIFGGCVEKEAPTPTPTPTPTLTPDIRNIVVTAENLNYDLRIDGEPHSQIRYLTITNNNDETIYLHVSCDVAASDPRTVNVACQPTVKDSTIWGSLTVKPHTTRLAGIEVKSFRDARTVGEYSLIARVELKNDIGEFTVITEFPIHVKVTL